MQSTIELHTNGVHELRGLIGSCVRMSTFFTHSAFTDNTCMYQQKWLPILGNAKRCLHRGVGTFDVMVDHRAGNVLDNGVPTDSSSSTSQNSADEYEVSSAKQLGLSQIPKFRR